MMKSNKALARKILCGLLAAGVVGVSGSALAATAFFINNGSNANIDQSGKCDVGIYADGGNAIDFNGESIKIDTTPDEWGSGNVGVWAVKDPNGQSTINLGNAQLTKNIDIHVLDNSGKSDIAIGLWAYGSDNTISTDNGGLINVNGKNLNVKVESTNGWAYGIYAQNRTTDPNNFKKAEININTENTYVNVKSGEKGNADGVVAMSQGIVNINSNLEVHADNAIVARGDAIVKINEDGKHTTKLDGDMSFDYDKATSGTKVDADVTVNLTGSESYWNGNSKVTWGTGAIPEGLEKVTGIDLKINDGATWNPTYVEEANEGASGTAVLAQNRVTLDGGNIDLTNAKNQQIKIETLAGNNGTIKIGSEDNSLAVTKDNTATNLTVAATQQYAEKIASNDMSTAVNDLASKVKDETNPNADGDSKTAASNVYIPETTVAGAVTADIDKDGKATNVKEAVNETNAAVSDLASISLMTWRQENNDMNKRLGELRDSKGEHGAWARMARGKSKYGAQNVKNQYNYYQVGYDEKLSTNPNWTVGVALTRTEGNSTFATGTGENKHTGFAVYGSYLGDNGSFIDLIAKYARMDNEFNAVDGIGSGDYKTNGCSLSAEYGKRFTKDNGFWIEPQVELTYGTVGSVDYLTSKGANVHQDGMDSLVGRLGFSLGKNIKQGNVYVRASYLYDFDGDTKVTYTKEKVARSFEQDLGGGWWEVGVGTNLNLSEATHLYFDVEKTYGGNVATPWQWNAGVRWSF
ncbi:autotransporter outer membrane beta-barrel domain-containing protein [uncultured Phascolarctobacterium sp.]|uniref:autotransporter outer membrane beta-barrel domain-containing protein n=1 Tax=uncultured Phascolarctobacterium sp. TaxID=512296 RepID=UPI0025DC18D9|nr:autotransporter outer membrane beta-barrel domain-containing protein [uncultured Phascolarctobacterium sp.]